MTQESGRRKVMASTQDRMEGRSCKDMIQESKRRKGMVRT